MIQGKPLSYQRFQGFVKKKSSRVFDAKPVLQGSSINR